ncbi:MAG: ABC transporter substrate-binding protein [Chloroflexi bacterium]|nr:ABC transporter substrate-binding protein [Chloroflexota bacterium]
MHSLIIRALVLIILAALLAACASATPTALPTAAPAAPPATAPDKTAPTATAKPAAATPTAAAPTPTAAPKVKRGGTLRAAQQNDWVSMDPLLSSVNTPDRQMIYDPLVFWRSDSKGGWGPAPALAESWDLKGNTATFKLRKGVKFQDGSDWNAQVAKWNIDRFITNPKSRFKSSLGDIQSVEVVDDNTIRINMKQPMASLLPRLSSGQVDSPYMVSKAAVEKYGEEDFGRKNPVGSGPMQFVEWKSGDHVTLKKWDQYWQKGLDGQPLPYLDGIYYRLIIDDSVRLLELKAGNIDMTELIQGKDIASVKSSPEMTFTEGTWIGNNYRIAFNSTAGPFKDNLQLRQAALLALDREAMVKTLGLGSGFAAKYLLAPGMVGYDESLPTYRYDQAKAKQLVKESGFAEASGVTLLVISRQIDKQQGEMIKSMWDAVGIKTTIDTIERAAHTQKTQQARSFEVTTVRNTGLPDADITLTNLLPPKGEGGYTGLNDPALDKCLNDGRSTYDAKQQTEIYKQCQNLIYEGAWINGLWTQPWNWVTSSKMKGLIPSWGTNWELREVWLDR